MSWVERFYSETGRWWGGAESVISDAHHDRVATLRRLTGMTSGRVLDLGASYGNTAAAFALAGYTVTGIELSARIDYAQQHVDRVQQTPGAGELTFIRGDFNTLELDESVDLVTYWNGFGIGSDTELRQLLTTVARRWLVPGGYLVLDVFNPTQWINGTGGTERREASPEHGYPYSLSERTDYDPVRARFIDTWTRDGETEQLSQTQRCYSPADFLLLLEPTGLELVVMEVDGQPIDLGTPGDSSHRLFDSYQYQVALQAPLADTHG